MKLSNKVKEVIRNPRLMGVFILHCLEPIIKSEKFYLELQYYFMMGERMDMDNPNGLNQKLQWIKLNDRNPLYTLFVDKYKVKEYITKQFGAEYVVDNYGVWDSVDDINYDQLPNRFVLKTTHGGGGNGVVICDDKSTFNIEAAHSKLTKSLHSDSYRFTKEWPYKSVERKIIAEKLLLTKENKIPNDYKLHFINGELQFVYVSYDRRGVNDRCVYDSDWQRLPFVWIEENKYKPTMNTSIVPKPTSFNKMKEIGAAIAQNCKYVRVDFYDVDGQLYVGEITLFHGSGYDKFFPSSYDKYYGDKLNLKN